MKKQVQNKKKPNRRKFGRLCFECLTVIGVVARNGAEQPVVPMRPNIGLRYAITLYAVLE